MSRPPSPPARPFRLLAGLLVPVIAFVVLHQALGNATKALAITEAIPSLWVLAYAVSRRRIEPVGVIAFAGFGIALLVTIASGGSALPLELHRALFSGAVGLACLISLAARRPLLSIAKAKLEAPPATRPKPDTPDGHHALAVLTAIIGVMFLTNAAAQIILAFTVSTSTFGVVAHVATWAIIGTGLAVCALYLRRMQTHLQHSHTPLPPPEPEPQRSDSRMAGENPRAAHHG